MNFGMKIWIRALRTLWTVLTLTPDFRYEPQMVRPERLYYPHQEIVHGDPRVRRLRAGMQHPIEEME